ncbi:MAG: alpha/beta hydrolase [Dehalococcoidia bacterium]|nr:alpha/beta hydrolase [Dehalococcoidia bacterium]
MPLDPQVKKIVEQQFANGGEPVQFTAPGPAVRRTEDHLVEGTGGPIPVRIYTPFGPGPFPALVWLHGGGWVGGSVAMSDSTARLLCVGVECVVISVDYRLAPQHKFPAAAEDSYTAVEWIVRNAGAYDVDVNRVAVGGSSAGGNLAAAVALMARDRKGPKLVCQVLVYPVTNRDFTTKSYQELGGGEYGLSLERMKSFWEQYLAKPEDAKNPYAAPLQATDLRGLPMAVVQTGEYDPLRDEGEAYAERIKQAGVPTVSTRYAGLAHGYFNQWSAVDKGRDAIADVCKVIKEAFEVKAAKKARR